MNRRNKPRAALLPGGIRGLASVGGTMMRAARLTSASVIFGGLARPFVGSENIRIALLHGKILHHTGTIRLRNGKSGGFTVEHVHFPANSIHCPLIGAK